MKKIVMIAAVAALCVSCNNKEEFDAAGTFEATEVTVSSEASGRILSLAISEGDTVHQAVVVGEIDSVQLHLAKMQLEQTLSSMRTSRPDVSTQIAALKEQIAKQEVEKARIQNLLKVNAATGKQLDDVESHLLVLKNQLAAQQSTLTKNVSSIDAQSAAIEIQIAQTEDKLAKCHIMSPITGTVLAKYAEVGELAAPGKPLFKVADLQHIFLRVYLTSAQLADVALGDEVAVSADFGGDNRREYTGSIVWIASDSEFTPKSIPTSDDRANLVYAVKVAVENDGYIKLGMYGEIKLK